MCNKGHKYRKLNDHQLFCSRCGTTMNVNGYGWSWTYPYRPYRIYPTWTEPYWVGGSSTWTVTSGSVNTGNVTYTSWSDVANNVMGELSAEGREDSDTGADN